MRLKLKLGNFAPPVLFGCGNKNLLKQGGVAIFGPRTIREEDVSYTKKLAVAVSNYKKSIISGGTRDIDITAMRAALNANGTSIGVLAGSLIKTSVLERYRQYLLENTLVLVTSFNPEIGVNGNNAMVCNRYIYCFSDCAVIVDSTIKKRGIWKGAAENIKRKWVPTFVKLNNNSNLGNKILLKMGANHATLDIHKLYRAVNDFEATKLVSRDNTAKKSDSGVKPASVNRKSDNEFNSRYATENWSTGTRIFIDTSSLMEDAAEFTVWQFIIPTCRRFGIPSLFIVKSVWVELERLENSSKSNKQVKLRAKGALKLIGDLQDNNVVTIIGDENDEDSTDHIYFARFAELRYKYQLVLFTQDMSVAKKLLSAAFNIKNYSNQIEVFRVHADGPERWELCRRRRGGVKLVRFGHHSRFQTNQKIASFRSRSSHITDLLRENEINPRLPYPFERRKIFFNIDDTLIDTSIPEIGEIVEDADGCPFRLTEVIGSGGEGTIFETSDPKLVCKIYRREHLKVSNVEKIRLMTSRKIGCENICWPVSLALNANSEGVGFIMPKAIGRELRNSTFGKRRLEESFPHWTRLHIAKLAFSILDAISYLHELNVILGDINPANILVKDESNVFLVDCDSYQVEGFPCRVGMAPFLAPGLYEADLHSTLRTMAHEEFAIATLVFMVLHLGKPPYTYKGGGDLVNNVRVGYFPYSANFRDNNSVPSGPWGHMWKQLPQYIKLAFLDAFKEERYRSIGEWRELMERYILELNKGEVSDELYGSILKENESDHLEVLWTSLRKCYSCGKFFKQKRSEPACPDCVSRQDGKATLAVH